MNDHLSAPAGSVAENPQERVGARLARAMELRQFGKQNQAATELEAALSEARATPYEIEFETRIQLAMLLTDVYQSTNENQKAVEMLGAESAFAEKISQ